MRILDDGLRIDGRGLADIRPIACEVRPVPRPHGSALFTRGETQAIVFVTLGTAPTSRSSTADVAHRQALLPALQLPALLVGEARAARSGAARGRARHAGRARARRGAARRGAFPYTIRIVSDMLESNGSSSMATVCGGDALDDGRRRAAERAGRRHRDGPHQGRHRARGALGHPRRRGPPRRHGLQGHGHGHGITAVQMDIKIPSVDARGDGARARAGAPGPPAHPRRDGQGDAARGATQAAPRCLALAPRITTIQIKPDKIRDIIGPGGKVIRGIQDATKTRLDGRGHGQGRRSSHRQRGDEHAEAMIRELTQEAEIDRIYLGVVKRIVDFGAFVEIFPGTDGLIHISHLAEERVEKVTDVVHEGDEVLVRVHRHRPVGQDPAVAQGRARRRRRRTRMTAARDRRCAAACEWRIAPAARPRGSAATVAGASGSSGVRSARRSCWTPIEPGGARRSPPVCASRSRTGARRQVRPRSRPRRCGTGSRCRTRPARSTRTTAARSRCLLNLGPQPFTIGAGSDRPARVSPGRARRVGRGRGARRDRARRGRLRPQRRGRARGRLVSEPLRSARCPRPPAAPDAVGRRREEGRRRPGRPGW